MPQVITYPPDLCHHGIKGQSWGQRNGPPYPLDSSDRSAAEKKASGSGSEVSSSNKSSSNVTKSSGSSSKSSSSEKKSEDSENKSKTESKSSNKAKSKAEEDHELTKKKAKEMTDEELNKAIKRIENEQKYADLTAPQAKKSVSLGKSILNGLGEVTGSIAKTTLKDIGAQTAEYVLGVEINKLLAKYNAKNGIEDDKSIDPKNIQNRTKKK